MKRHSGVGFKDLKRHSTALERILLLMSVVFPFPPLCAVNMEDYLTLNANARIYLVFQLNDGTPSCLMQLAFVIRGNKYTGIHAYGNIAAGGGCRWLSQPVPVRGSGLLQQIVFNIS